MDHPYRRARSDKSALLTELAKIAGVENTEAWVETLQVREMDDGGMGSLEIETPASENVDRTLVRCAAAVQFTDADGVEVIASLNARVGGMPFELDMRKTDFSRLIRIPPPRRFRRVEAG